jgi:hypothetical protein
MSRRSQRLLISWVAACALLLKAAVPLLAATAAQWQGVPVAHVCNIYGVTTSQMLHAEHHAGHAHHHHATSDAGHDGDSHSAADHGRDHCALTAIVTMAVGQAVAPPPAPTDAAASHPERRGASSVADACALWVARLGHGPPAFA